ncbi:MAG: SGNH/GDSL hydrolase family protein [Rikenellaceae bacterium]
MKRIFLSILFLFAFSIFVNGQNLNVLLIGDSTTKGALPATVHPERQQLKDMITTWFNANSAGKKLTVYNCSKGGESAKTIVSEGRYEQEVTPYKDMNIDIIIVRYGINDWFKCKDIDKDFPTDLDNLWKMLKKDFPKAKFIAQTITPFLKDNENERMNEHIKAVARRHKIAVNDIYTPFLKAMQKNGENNYWVRMAPLENFPTKYHEMLKPYIGTTVKRGKKVQIVQVDDNSLDYFFIDPIKEFKGKNWEWVNHHPNSAGYSIVARETAEFLLENFD